MKRLGSWSVKSEGTRSQLGDLGLLFFRVVIGLSIALSHGIGKVPPSDGFISAVASMGFPLPFFFAWMAGLSELLGGVLIALGFLARPAAFFLLQTMIVAVFIRHWGAPFNKVELGLLYGSACVMILCIGVGRYSLDAALFNRDTQE